MSNRPGGVVRFSNGATAPLGYEVAIDLEEITQLTCAQVIADIATSVEEHGPLPEAPQVLYVYMQGADQRFGIDLGYGRLAPQGHKAGRDSFDIDLKTGEVSVGVVYPVLREHAIVIATLRTATAHTDFEIARVRLDEADHHPYCDVSLRVPPSAPVSQIAEICQFVLALLLGGNPVPDSPVSAYQALASGRVDALLNLTENTWFEAKQNMYGLADASQRFELALDVASFANTTHGGLIVVGVKTHKDEHGRDVVSEIPGRSHLAVSVAQLEDIIHQMVHPYPRALSITVFHPDGRDLLAILVPPQSAAFQPFLVLGTPVASGKVYGGGFAWVERHGSSKRNMSISDVHNLLRNAVTERASGL